MYYLHWQPFSPYYDSGVSLEAHKYGIGIYKSMYSLFDYASLCQYYEAILSNNSTIANNIVTKAVNKFLRFCERRYDCSPDIQCVRTCILEYLKSQDYNEIKARAFKHYCRVYFN